MATAVSFDLVNVFTCPSASLSWLVRNPNSQKEITAPYFSSEKCDYSLRLYPSIREMSYRNISYTDVSIEKSQFQMMAFLHGILKEKQEKLYVHYRFSFLNVRGEKCFAQEGSNFVAEYGSIYKTNQTYPIAQFGISCDHLRDKAFLIDGNITFICEIFEFDDTSINKNFNQDCLLSHSKNQKALMDSGKGSDVILVAGNQELKAHKLILSMHSQVFSAMFDHDNTKEAKEGKVEMIDVSAAVCKQLLAFIYTGQVQDMAEIATELLIAAEKYQIDALKSYCSTYLSSTLTTENVSELLQLADRHNAAILKASCLKYITTFSQDIDSNALQILATNPQFSFELFQLLTNRCLKK